MEFKNGMGMPLSVFFGLKSIVSTLQQFPYMGSFYKNRQERFIVYKNFLIVYEIQEKEKIVRIKTIGNRRMAR